MAAPLQQQQQQQQQQSSSWPLFDVFLELPHPEASKSCPAPVSIESPQRDAFIRKEILEDPNSMGRMTRFAFPEHDDRRQSLPPSDLNRHDVYMTKGFQHHSFSLQLSNGQRVYGHVRRYLPTHSQSPPRYDVGRRGVRALIILTRATGGDTLFACMLKTIDALTALKGSVSEFTLAPLQKKFLHSCYNKHLQMVHAYHQRKEEERKPMILTVEGLEFSNSERYNPVDTNRFLIPTPLLQHQMLTTTAPILPLLRCLGVSNALRLLSGLLSERRVVLISSSPTRLTTCCRSALSVLAQGLLSWQHFLMPVLPPHLLQYLQAPFPYLIGILSEMIPTLNQLPELGEVLLINLDTNGLETRGMGSHEILSKIPDLFQSGMRDEANIQNVGAPQQATASAPQFLAEDLIQLLKADKKAIVGESTLGSIVNSAQVTKAAKAVKSAFGKIRGKLRHQDSTPEELLTLNSAERRSNERKTAVTEDEIYTEGCQNEVGEEEARVAFSNFFLCIYGDMRWYLTPPQPGQTPALDRDRFLQQKSSLGDGRGSPLFPLLQNICQSQMFEQFVKARVDEISRRVPITKDAPLFNVCSNYHRAHNIDFSVGNVRRVSRQVAQANPSRLISQANANARRMAMSLTSNKVFEGDVNRALAQLVEYCRETTVLMDVMSVVWMRLRDSKGGQWKHAHLGLQIIRNLLFHGPLAAIAEATDGLDKIRALKFYKETMRNQNSQQVQQAAHEVYNLLVDRTKLFSIRRYCGNRRAELREPRKWFPQKDQNVRFGMSFRSLHPYMHPRNTRQVAPAPVAPTQVPQQQQQQQQHMPPQQMAYQQQMARQQPQQQAYTPQHAAVPPAPQPAPAGLDDLLGLNSVPPAPAPAAGTSSVGQLEASMSNMNVFDPFGGSTQSLTATPAPTASAPAAPAPSIPPAGPPAHQHPQASYHQQPPYGQVPPQQQRPAYAQRQQQQYPGYAPQQQHPANQQQPQFATQQAANLFAPEPQVAPGQQQQNQQQRPAYLQFDPMSSGSRI